VTEDGKRVLRFATADRMRQACVGCHNTHPDTPKSGWRVGDVRGVLEVAYPLAAADAAMAFSEDRMALFAVPFGVVTVLLIGLLVGRMRAESAELEQRVAARTSELEASEALLRRQIAEKEQIQAAVQESQKMEAVGRLAGGIAHDFNNNLTVILGCAELLEADLEPDSEAYEDLQQIVQAAEHGASLTRELLGFSRSEPAQYATVDLNEAVRRTVEVARRTVGTHITLSDKLDPDLLPVWIDVGQLDRVLMNLTLNARDAMPEGGELVLSTRMVGADERGPDGAAVGCAMAELSVSDTGTGMEPAVQSRIFEPFFTTKKVGDGTGMGLASVYGVVQQAGGGITVESKVGEGTRMRVWLPVAPEAPAPALLDGAGGVLPAPVTHKQTILLVDDDDGVRRVVSRILQGAGYTVLEASGGVAALQELSRRPEIALLLTDIVMPNMTGPELVANVRLTRPTLPAIFMSGYPSSEAMPVQLLDDGVPLLSKPIARLQLLDEVVRTLRGPDESRPAQRPSESSVT